MTVPSNLIPVRVTELPRYEGHDPSGYTPYSINGKSYRAQLLGLVAFGFVPNTRSVNTGTGLLGGGDLSEDRTLYLDYGDGTPGAPLGVASPGFSSHPARADHVHPMVDLSGGDAGELTGILPMEHGGSGAALVPNAGGVLYSTTSALAIAAPGTVGAFLVSTGAGAPQWVTFSPVNPQKLGVANPGTSPAPARADHVHPAVDLTDPGQITGVLPPAHGGLGATNLTGYVIGHGTSGFTASPAIPVADVSGTKAQFNNSLTDGDFVFVGDHVPVADVDGAVPEAPIDGKQYARKDAAWAEVTAKVEEAPIDGRQYARQDAAWHEVNGFPEAPIDGKQYARQDADWSEVIGAVTEAPTDGRLYARQGSTASWQPAADMTAQRREFIAAGGETVFATTYPYVVGYLDVYVNGVRLATAEYNATNGTTAILTNPVVAGDVVVLDGFTSAAVTVEMTAQRVEYIATAGQTTFATTYPYAVGFMGVYVNGVRLANSEFTATDGVNVVLTTPATAGYTVLLEGFVGGAVSGPGPGTMAQFDAACTDGDFVWQTKDATLGNLTVNGYVSAKGPGSTAFAPNVTTMWVQSDQAYNSGVAGGGISFSGKYNAAGASLVDFGFISGVKENLTDGDYNGALLFGTRPNGSGGGNFERMRITSTGRVGIGTATPLVALQVKAFVSPQFLIEATSPRGSGGCALAFHDPTGQKGYIGYGDANDVFTVVSQLNADMVFQVNAVERMRIFADGNFRLSGLVANQYSGITLQSKYATASQQGYNYIETVNSENAQNGLLMFQQNIDGSTEFLISTTPPGSRTVDRRVERMRVYGDGNTIFKNTVKVQDSINGGIWLTRGNGTTTSGYINFMNTGGASLGYIGDMPIASGGHIAYSNSNGGAHNFFQPVYAPSYPGPSDERLKVNIVDAPAGTGALIDAMRVVSFDWKDTGKHRQYGLIAQQVNTVYPDVVFPPTDEAGENAWGVDNSMLVPLLIKEIQSLRARLAAAGIA